VQSPLSAQGRQSHFLNTVKNMLNDDQIKKLGCEYKRMPKWCDSTLVKAYQLKFACGLSGYKELEAWFSASFIANT